MKKLLTRDIALILLASFFYMASPMLVTPLIVGFSKGLGAGATITGMLGGMMNLCSLVCRPLAGNIADKISKYRLSWIGAALMLLACVGYTTAQNVAVVALSRVVNGLGFSCCSVCLSTWMSNLLPRDKIGSGMGLYGTMNALSMAIAPALGLAVRDALGSRAAFALAAAFALLTLILVQFVHDKGLPTQTSRPAGQGRGFALVERRAVPLALVIMCFGIPYCATQSFLDSYVSARSLDVPVGMFFPIYAAVLLVLRLSLKSLFDKLPFRVFLLAGSLCALGSMLCLWQMEGPLLMALAAALMAGGYGIMCSVCQSAAILAAGEERRGLANSTYYIGMDLGMALGPILGGWLFDALPAAWFYPALMLAVPLCLAVYALAQRLAGKKSS